MGRHLWRSKHRELHRWNMFEIRERNKRLQNTPYLYLRIPLKTNYLLPFGMRVHLFGLAWESNQHRTSTCSRVYILWQKKFMPIKSHFFTLTVPIITKISLNACVPPFWETMHWLSGCTFELHGSLAHGLTQLGAGWYIPSRLGLRTCTFMLVIVQALRAPLY